MAFFIWKDSFNIGIEEIDQQHREFLVLKELKLKTRKRAVNKIGHRFQ